MSKADEKRQQRTESLMDEMSRCIVATPEGLKKLGAIVDQYGVKNAVYYYNTVEKKVSGMVAFKKEDVVFDQGLIFKNGLELRRIEKRFVNFFRDNGCEVVEKRERVPGYSL